MSRVIITGGTGFLGQLVGRSLLQRGHIIRAGQQVAIKELVLADVARPAKLLFDELESQARVEIGDRTLHHSPT